MYEYSFLIEEIRKELRQGYTLSAAIDRAIDTCIKAGVLVDLLRKERVRVKNTILFEYDEERIRKSEYQDGYETGLSEGYNKMIENQIRHLISLNLSDDEICRYANCDQSLLETVRAEMKQ